MCAPRHPRRDFARLVRPPNPFKDPPEPLATGFSELGIYERHFNELQSRYRTLTSTWLLGAIAAIGFILTQDLNISVDRSLLVAAIGLAGACGVGLLWNLDLMVYHRLLEAVFSAGQEFESKHWQQLPQIRDAMYKAMDSHGVVPRVIFFYLGTAGSLLLVAIVAFTVWLAEIVGWWSAPIAVVLTGTGGGLLMWMYDAAIPNGARP
jgi:hypothetical protein